MSKELPEKAKGIESTSSAPTYLPPVDIYEKDRSLVVLADMPGVDEKSVDVNFEQGVLTIRGQVEKQQPEGYRAIYREYEVGDFERSFTVPEQIDVEKIEAKVKNGVLSITLPYLPEPEPKKITVKVG